MIHDAAGEARNTTALATSSGVGNVAGYHQRSTAKATNGLGDCADLVFTSCGQHDITPRLSQADGNSLTDSPAGAGDHSDPSGEREAIKHRVSHVYVVSNSSRDADRTREHGLPC